MGFPGVWMTQSERVVYRVVPKCACSTIGQILYHADHGHFHAGDIHDARSGLHKWAMEDSRPLIERAVLGRRAFAFTCVRNPYERILSAFFDKIAGIQRNGRRYRDNLVPMLMRDYGLDVGGDDGRAPFDQIAAFRRFLLFARDTIRFRNPMDPDIHWSSISGHVSTFVANGGRYDLIFATEHFRVGMGEVLNHLPGPNRPDLAAIPRFNESEGHGPARLHPVEDYFDDLSRHLVAEIYRRDFDLFRYDAKDPSNRLPRAPVDLDEVHEVLGR